jgi:hypothetical protein
MVILGAGRPKALVVLHRRPEDAVATV